ncbi:hypothetical protein RMSM_07320 [Rhodopirellula maiorica SM1]|uniref:Uncharacterized protein n=1 Tax=Rhodopirellula maiorica SM1 TaxID=1265738 RepID=M5RP62_9BACT|nr:hypothetical protein RMSM_07320 [Rhodopirellula maiorica SM1]
MTGNSINVDRVFKTNALRPTHCDFFRESAILFGTPVAETAGILR